MNDLRDEELGSALDRSAKAIETEPVDRLPEVLWRGTRRRAVRFTAVSAAVAVFAGAVTWAGITFPRQLDRIPADITDWRRFASVEDDGWTIQVPPPWRIHELRECDGFARLELGVLISNTDFEFRNPQGDPPRCGDRFVFARFPRTGVALTVQPHLAHGIGRPQEDTALPLTPDLLIRTGGIRGGPSESFLSIWAEGEPVVAVRRWVGANARPADIAALDRLLGSLRVRGTQRWVEANVQSHGLVVRLTHPERWVVTPRTEVAGLDDQQPLVRLASPEVGGSFCLEVPWGDFGTLGDYGVVVLISDATSAWGPAEVDPRPERFRPPIAVEDQVVRCGQDIRVLRFLYEESRRRIAVDVVMTTGVLREGPQVLWHVLDSVRVEET